jgi:hypothetical protein
MIIVALTFLAAGVTAALAAGMGGHELARSFLRGVKSIAPSVLMILMASSIRYTMVEGHILDALLHAAVGAAGGLSRASLVLFIYLICLDMNFFIPSGSAKAFLLIPADAEPNLALTVAPEFIGTTEATTIAASTDTQTNYACNGKAFVYVKDAISAGANKAWLEIPASANGARQLKIVFADATGIGAVSGLPADNGDWFDLNGRKLQAAPTKKGVYIKDGKKVVVK